MLTRFANLLSIVYSVVFLGALVALLVWAWVRWLKQPRVRGALPAMFVGGLASVSVSVLIGIATFIRQLLNPVLLYFDPVVQRMTGVALLISLLAVLLSICGVFRKNPIRWHSLALSVLLFLMWLGAATDM